MKRGNKILNLHLRKITNYPLVFLLLIGVAMFVYFFIPALRRLNSERLSVTQLHEKLTEQRHAIEGFQHPTEEEKLFWNDSKQRLKAMCQVSTDTLLLIDELAKQASYCDVSDFMITPQGMKPHNTDEDFFIERLPLGMRENKLLLKISFHTDYESLGRFLQWFDEHPHLASILSLNVKRGLPLVSAEMDVEAHQLSCNF